MNFRRNGFRKRAEVYARVSIALGAALLADSSSVWARGDKVPGSRYDSARDEAMGDAAAPFADDAMSSLFSNPAGIAKIRKPSFEMLNLGLQTNQDYLSTAGLGFFNFSSLSSFQSQLAKNPSSFPGAQVSAGMSYGIKGFAFGALYQTRIAATSDGTHTHYKSLYQLIPSAGFGLPLASGVLRMGYSIQYINQASGDLTVASTSSPLGYNQHLAQGSAFSHTASFQLTLPYAYTPSFSVIGRNLGGTKFSSSSLFKFAQNPSGAPSTEPMSIDTGLALEPKLGSGINNKWSFVYRDTFGSSGMSLLGRMAFGTEVSLRDHIHLRAGVASAYPSIGLGLSAERADFNLSWFSEETGSSLRSQRDIRLMLQFQLRAF